MFKHELINLIEKQTNLSKEEIEKNIEIPKEQKLGDYAFPCFILAKILKKNPGEIALNLAEKIKKPIFIERIDQNGPYLNFFINKQKLVDLIIKKVIKEKENYAKNKEKKKIVIESPGPNTNKPLHLGHLRNMALGLSLSKINEKIGNKVINVDIINDRGIHICKSMLAYKKFGNNKKPNKKPDHFVGDYYVLFNKKLKENPELEKEVLELLNKWEQKDTKTVKLAEKMNSWALKGIRETYKRFGIKVDKVYYETEYYEKGKKIVLDALKKGIFSKDNKGNVVIDLSKENLGEKVLLRQDGTSLYITQDLYLAVKRYRDFGMDKMIYVVASEQIYHFRVLFKILELLGYKFVNYCHLAYGMVYLPEGRMKSREGAIVDADDIIDEIINLAKKEILKRNKEINKKELDKRAEVIGLGAIKYYILKHDVLKDFTYYPEKSISFEGDTGPYIQYSHARISSILRKDKKFSINNLKLLKKEEEINLVKILLKYPDIVNLASKQLKPSLIANYLFELAQEFHSFYSKYPVLKTEKELRKSRLALILAIKIVLKDGLNLLGIEAPERM